MFSLVIISLGENILKTYLGVGKIIGVSALRVDSFFAARPFAPPSSIVEDFVCCVISDMTVDGALLLVSLLAWLYVDTWEVKAMRFVQHVLLGRTMFSVHDE